MPVKKLVTNMIKISRVRDDLLALVNKKLDKIPVCTFEEKWNAFKSIVYNVFKEKRDTAVRKHED